MRRQIVSTMYNNGDYFYFQNNFLCFCIYVTNVCSAFMLSPITKIRGFWYLVGLWSCEIHKNTLNTAKLARNLITYMSIQHIWNLSWQLGLCSCCKLANLSWNFTTTSNIKHTQVISANLSISSEICPENSYKISCFLLIGFRWR